MSTTTAAALASRRPRIEGEREAELLDATVRVLGEVGYDRLTMDLVAAQARASKATLYRRWTSKASLVVDAISRAKGLPPVEPPGTGSLRGDLLASWCGHDSWGAKLPMSVMAGLMTAVHADKELGDAFRDQFLGPRITLGRKMFEQAKKRGEIARGVDLDLVMSLLPAMCIHREFILAESPDEKFVTAVIDQIILPACQVSPPRRRGARS